MKKVRKLVALTIAASVTLSSAMPVFAANSPGRFATGTPMAVPVTLPDEVPQEEAPVIFPNLAHTSRIFRDNQQAHRGYIPVLSNAAPGSDFERLNDEFLANAQRASWAATDFSGRTVGTFDGFWADFSVVNLSQFGGGSGVEIGEFDEETANRLNRFAVVTQTLRFGGATHLVNPERVQNQVFVYFIDKSTNRQVSADFVIAFIQEIIDELEVALEDLEIEEAEIVEDADEVEEAEEAEDADEAAEEAAEAVAVPAVETLFPVLLAAEYGFVVSFDEDENLVAFLGGDALVAVFVVGEDIALVFDGEEVEELQLSEETYIDAASGEIFAPIDFFAEALGIVIELVEVEAEVPAEEEELEEELEE